MDFVSNRLIDPFIIVFKSLYKYKSWILMSGIIILAVFILEKARGFL